MAENHKPSDMELDIASQILAIQQEASRWAVLRHQLTLRYRIQKRIGAVPEALAQIEAELQHCEKFLFALDEEMEKVRMAGRGNHREEGVT